MGRLRGLETNLGLVLVSLLSSCVSFNDDFIFSEINMGIIILPSQLGYEIMCVSPQHRVCT